MKRSTIMTTLIQVFMPHRPSHYVTKPLLTMAAFLGCYLLADYLFYSGFSFHSPYQILLIAIVQAPFLALAFVLLTHLSNTQRKLADLAMTDVLTGLPNRRRFMDGATHALRRKSPGFLLILDADHFKRINDTYGHAVGDICLEAISERLMHLKKPNDLIGRIGGEEFGAFLPDRAEKDVLQIGQQLTRAITIDNEPHSNSFQFTMSVGAAEANSKDDLIALMRRADEALYEAKTTGRAKLVFWRKSVRENHTMRAG